ncbi:MAG: hypothetical protein R3229_05555 [Alphaproteobacteria bacterium]|nr:hypothetical protein [Alphaproteobacteria bacterium]
MAYRFAAGVGKDRFPALIAKDPNLPVAAFRAAIALFNHAAQSPEKSATLGDIAAATGLAPEAARAALGALIGAGYVEAAAPPRPAAPAPREAVGRARRRPGKSARLEAGIMNYELDLERLMQAGDANVRGTRSALFGKAQAPEPPAAGDEAAPRWDPLGGEESQPPAMRFMVWLRFVLSPDELLACDRFALAHKDAWGTWIERFAAAKATGGEGALLDDIRERLAEGSGAAEPSAGPGNAPPSRPH